MLCSSSDCCLCGLRICWTICAWKVDQINFASGISGSCVSLNGMSRTRLQFHTRERGARRLAEPQNSQRPKGSSTEVHPTRAFSLDNRAEARKTQQIVMPGRGIVVMHATQSQHERCKITETHQVQPGQPVGCASSPAPPCRQRTFTRSHETKRQNRC